MNFGESTKEGEKFRGTLNSIAYGEVMGAAARNLQKVSERLCLCLCFCFAFVSLSSLVFFLRSFLLAPLLLSKLLLVSVFLLTFVLIFVFDTH